MLKEYWWIPIVLIWYGVNAYFSKKSNEYGGNWIYLTFISNICPLWAIVATHSNRLLFDALLYDVFILFSYVSVLIIMGSAKQFNLLQWVGLIVVILGFIFLKIG